MAVSVPLESAISEWQLAGAPHWAATTMAHKRSSGERFLEYVRKTIPDREPTIDDIDRRLLRSFAGYLTTAPIVGLMHTRRIGQTISAGTQHGILRDVSHFVRWAKEEELFERPPEIPRDLKPRIPRTVLPTPSPDEVRKLLAAVERSYDGPQYGYSKSLTPRGRALLALMLDSGLRLGEITRLDLKDYDRLHGRLKVRDSKGGDSRDVYLGPESRTALDTYIRKPRQTLIQSPRASKSTRRYLDAMDEDLSDDRDEAALFVDRSGGRMSTSAIAQWMSDLCARAHIERYTPHALRRFYATQAANSGIPLTVLREQLGHADLTTTQRYLAHNAETQRTAAVAASPLSGLLRDQGRRRRRPQR